MLGSASHSTKNYPIKMACLSTCRTQLFHLLIIIGPLQIKTSIHVSKIGFFFINHTKKEKQHINIKYLIYHKKNNVPISAQTIGRRISFYSLFYWYSRQQQIIIKNLQQLPCKFILMPIARNFQGGVTSTRGPPGYGYAFCYIMLFKIY